MAVATRCSAPRSSTTAATRCGRRRRTCASQASRSGSPSYASAGGHPVRVGQLVGLREGRVAEGARVGLDLGQLLIGGVQDRLKAGIRRSGKAPHSDIWSWMIGILVLVANLVTCCAHGCPLANC